MNIILRPSAEICVEKRRIDGVPTLILRPAKRSWSNTAVLWIHGGGYLLGMKEMVYMSRAADLVTRYGVTVFSPGYRLAWQQPYPAAANDCYTVLQYMDANRKALGFERLMVGGESAGGGLCAAVCMMARDRGIQVAFQMPLYPMLDNFDTESSRNNTERSGTPGATTWAGGPICARTRKKPSRLMPLPHGRAITEAFRPAIPSWGAGSHFTRRPCAM